MTSRTARRMGLSAFLAMASAACAHGTTNAGAFGPADGPMCEVRVESAYATPIEAGARTGGREIQLGIVDPGQKREFTVPCANRAVTIYRVVRSGGDTLSRVGTQARALSAEDVTEVRLRPRG